MMQSNRIVLLNFLKIYTQSSKIELHARIIKRIKESSSRRLIQILKKVGGRLF
mgnify:CR=1 FL=1